MPKIVEYVFLVSDEDRIRHYHEIKGGEVKRFTVQYETRLQKKWLPVVRYDTAHGFAHRDLIHPDGRTEKTSLDISDFNDALTFAQKKIKNEWWNFKIQFLKESKK